jgi:hypothetical protein
MRYRVPFSWGVFALCLAFLTSSVWAETVYLDQLDLTKSVCGWSNTKANRSANNNPLSVGGQAFERGVGTHPNGHIAVQLDGFATRFTAKVGIDDEVGTKGHAEFQIFGDEELLWRSDFMIGGQAAQDVEVDLEGVELLLLIVDTGPEGFGHDHTDWIEAAIEYSGAAPKTIYVTKTRDGRYVQELTVDDLMDEMTARYVSLQRQIANPLPDHVNEQAFRVEATILPEDRDPIDVVLRRTHALLQKLQEMENGPTLTAEGTALAALNTRNVEIALDDQEARTALFADVLELRRAIAFQNPLLAFEDILFIKRHFNPNSEKTGNHMCDQFFGFHGRQGGGLYVLEGAFTDEPSVRGVLDDITIENGRYEEIALDKSWAFLSPELSYDGETILFAATDAKEPRHTYTWDANNTYHIFQTNIAGDYLRQVTDGPYNDFDPCVLPNGRIAFISERRGGYGRCHGRPVPSYTLHSMNYDGSDITMLSPHETNEWQPSVGRNGMILYTRWDYVDRGFNQAHHPWITTPDGCDSRPIHGNYGRAANARPHFEADIRQIAGSDKLVATAACHHGQGYGALVVIDPKVPDDDAMGPVRRLTPDQMFPEAEVPTHRGPADYSTAMPLSEDFYLCVYDAFSKSDAGEANNYGLYLIDSFGNRILLHRDPAISCMSPLPVRERIPPVNIPPRTLAAAPLQEGDTFFPYEDDELPTHGNITLINVYDTERPFADDVVINSLRIVQLLPKTTPFAHNPAIGYGSQKGARSVLGTVPVEEDGSAYFSMPVNVPVYFQALDENGMAIQSMRSATYVHPGEELVCQGCHERRHSRAGVMRNLPDAVRRPPSEIEAEVDGSNPFNYPRLVQPVLDAHCVECHAEPTSDTFALDQGAQGQHFFTSYQNLKSYSFYFDSASWTEPKTFPGQFGAHASKLYQLLAEGHHDVELAPEEMRRLTLWLDSNSDFYGSYENIEPQRAGEVVWPTLY